MSSGGGMDLEDVLSVESKCPRFVLLCQNALTSARHNCARLSQKVAAMWQGFARNLRLLMWGEKIESPMI